MPHPGGRPVEYSPSHVEKAKAYLASCIDERKQDVSATKSGVELKSRLVVRIPSKGGMAIALGVARETLYDWAKKYPEFSDIMEAMGAIQEQRLLENGLSGDYNPTIAKVLLTKHGYREGIDSTTNDKDLPSPILNVSGNNSDKKDSPVEEED